MFILAEKLKAFMKRQGWSAELLAGKLDVELAEVEKMLNGEYIDIDTARKFVKYFKVPLVLAYIDFAKTGVENPFA